MILRVEAGLFFANADQVRGHIVAAARRDGTRVVILDASNIAFVDVTAVTMLDELAETLKTEGVALRVSRDIGTVRDVLRRAGSEPDLQRVYTSVQAAVDASQSGPGGSSAPPRSAPAHIGRGQPLSTPMPSPISLTPMTSRSTAMMVALLAAIQSLSSPRSLAERSPIAK